MSSLFETPFVMYIFFPEESKATISEAPAPPTPVYVPSGTSSRTEELGDGGAATTGSLAHRLVALTANAITPDNKNRLFVNVIRILPVQNPG
jgi:hypothetical protein